MRVTQEKGYAHIGTLIGVIVVFYRVRSSDDDAEKSRAICAPFGGLLYIVDFVWKVTIVDDNAQVYASAADNIRCIKIGNQKAPYELQIQRRKCRPSRLRLRVIGRRVGS